MLSLMAKNFFADSPVLFFPVCALVLFVVAFSALTLRALRKPAEDLDAMAQLPLESEETL